MASQIGVQPNELRLLGNNFRTEGDAVQSLLTRLDRQMTEVGRAGESINGKIWVGDSAARFGAQWDDEFRPVLINLADALDLACNRLMERAESADQYDRA